jgi:hypothetical protein
MKMHPTKHKSTNVVSVGFDGVNTMRVEFHHGKQYDYSPVTSQQAQDVHDSASPGKALTRLGIVGKLVIPVTP